MRICVKRLTAALLTVLLLTGGVCTQAAYYVQATRPGDPNPTRRDLMRRHRPCMPTASA